MARKASRKPGKAKAKAKRPGRSKPLVAESQSVRRAPRPARQRTTAAEPLTQAFPLMGTMHGLAMANIDHAGRLAACRTPIEFWLEQARFGQIMMAQWHTSAQRTLSRSAD